MPKFNFGGLVDAVAYGALDEILGMGRSNDGIAKPSRYEVTLFPPSGQQGSRGQSNNIFSKIMGEILGDGTVRATGLKCEGIELPGRTIDTTPDTNIYGPERNIATGYTFADITGTFQLSSDLKEKKYFETWQRLCYNPQTFAMGYYDDYIGSVDIHTMDEQNKKRYGVKLVECFPKSIGAQQLSYAGTGYLTCAVTFSYRYWKNLTDEADLPKPLLDRIAERAVNTVTRRITSQIPSVLRRL
tara:strand:- start:534 stop:1262 length:729 start_codon:yes stop_codon:yes gene_type:complete